MKKILVIQHVPFEGLGHLSTWFQIRGIHHEIVRFFEDPTPPSIDAFDALIILGGPMSVEDVVTMEWFGEEFHWLKEAIKQTKPILGICLGAQLLAKLTGGSVLCSGTPEIGWHSIDFHPKALEHPLFKGWPKKTDIFQWHQDHLTPPVEALEIGQSRACGCQGFVLGHITALQFHMEMTPAIVKRLVDSSRGELRSLEKRHEPYVACESKLLNGFAPFHLAKSLFIQFLDRWIDLR